MKFTFKVRGKAIKVRMPRVKAHERQTAASKTPWKQKWTLFNNAEGGMSLRSPRKMGLNTLNKDKCERII